MQARHTRRTARAPDMSDEIGLVVRLFVHVVSVRRCGFVVAGCFACDPDDRLSHAVVAIVCVGVPLGGVPRKCGGHGMSRTYFSMRLPALYLGHGVWRQYGRAQPFVSEMFFRVPPNPVYANPVSLCPRYQVGRLPEVKKQFCWLGHVNYYLSACSIMRRNIIDLAMVLQWFFVKSRSPL